MFHDLESGKDLYIDPAAARARYRQNFQTHAAQIEKDCRDLGIDLYQFPTNRPLEITLFDVLQSRLHAGRHVTRAANRGIARST
jgi:hypothetical protein